MENTKKIISILALAVAFCFGLASLAQAVKPPWSGEVLGEPIWGITQEGTAEPVDWVDHAPNPRFAIYDPATPEDQSDDLVLDKETGLIWPRNANLSGPTPLTWGDALNYCRGVTIGNRMGWRLPTVEELSSLVNPSGTGPVLPSGHPFINVMAYYWSSSTHGTSSLWAWQVHFNIVHMDYVNKTTEAYVLPVRGGNGYATGNW